MLVAISTVKPGGSDSVATKRADSVAEYPGPPVAGTAGFVAVAEPVACFVPPASAVEVVGEPQAVTRQRAATATDLCSTILSTGHTPLSPRGAGYQWASSADGQQGDPRPGC
ncbi:hypothetical protein IW248_004811 [Micromonospora ureilytica]|uniref:Uncharacterized protein n=1 Tax=Micromonospora ureilytica TaxID=709868 RepID=A0ABS0JN93_9ACTN|nr:hypothetical protein [Micromonospora ureilytica]